MTLVPVSAKWLFGGSSAKQQKMKTNSLMFVKILIIFSEISGYENEETKKFFSFLI